MRLTRVCAEPTAEQLKELQNWLAQATCQQCVAEPRLGMPAPRCDSALLADTRCVCAGWDVATGKCGFEFTNKVCPKVRTVLVLLHAVDFFNLTRILCHLLPQTQETDAEKKKRLVSALPCACLLAPPRCREHWITSLAWR